MSREFSLRTRADTRWLYIVNCVIKSRQLASAPAVFCVTVEGRVLNFLECVTVGLGQLNPRKFVQSSNQTQIVHKHQFRNTEGAQPTIVSSLRSLSAIEWTERRTTVLWLSNATKTFGGRRLQVVCREILQECPQCYLYVDATAYRCQKKTVKPAIVPKSKGVASAWICGQSSLLCYFS